MDYDMMRRRHGRGQSGRSCGECVWAKKPMGGDEGERHCKTGRARCAHVVGEDWPACGHFKTPWRIERELLEQLGQKCIEFETRGGVALG